MARVVASHAELFPERLISGFQPFGPMHLGHYFGAIVPCLRFQNLYPGECFVLVADLHYLTRGAEAERRGSRAVFSTLAGLLALGLDPSKAVLYRQSDVPQTAEMMWLLSCYTSKGDLDRGHAVKAAANRGDAVSAGTYLYPLLQAADILGISATRVPAGRDQAQHVELARQVARRVNNRLGDKLLPEPVLASAETVGTVVGTDGVLKMSSQHGNVVSIFEDERTVRSEINSIASLDVPLGTAIEESASPIAQFIRLVAPKADADQAIAALMAGESGFRDAKAMLYDSFLNRFSDARREYSELMDDRANLEEILNEGAVRAGKELGATVLSLKESLGM